MDSSIFEEVQAFLAVHYEKLFFMTIGTTVIVCFFIDWLDFAKPPGPNGVPFLGNLPFLGSAPHKTLAEYARHYGRAFSISLGSVDTVVVSDLQLVQQLLAMDEFNVRPKMHINHGLAKGKGILSAEGPAHQAQRALVSNALQDLRKTNVEARIQITVREFVQELRSYAGNAAPIDQAVVHHVGNALSDMILGQKFSHDNQQWSYLKAVQRQRFNVFSVVGLLNYVPWVARFCSSYGQVMADVKESHAKSEQIFKSIVEKRAASPDAKSVLDAYVTKARTQRTEALSVENISAVMSDVLNLSWETTSATVQWLFLYMAGNPKIQDKVITEIKGTIGSNKEASLADIDRMPYTQACVLEALRHSTALPFGIPHALTKRVDVAGYEFPKGTMILPFLYGIHHDPRVWKNPDLFNPERHLDDDGYLCENENIIPFQSGKRSCVGEDIARHMILLFFVNAMVHFSFKAPKGTKLSLDKMAECGLTLSPKPFKLQAESH